MAPGAAGKREQNARDAARNTGESSEGPAAYDGPNDPPRGRAGSNAGPNRSASRGTATRTASQTRESQMQTARAMQRPTEQQTELLKNVDFGGNAYSTFSQMPSQSMHRAGFGKAGKQAKIQINSHIVKAWPERPVYQYDVLIGSGAEKRGLIKSVWESKAVQKEIGKGFIFDGNKIGWAPTDFKRELRIRVDLDAERGITPRDGHSNTHSVRINKASNDKVNLGVVKAYLEGTIDFDNSILQAINFLDHLLRETPSKTLINLRRSYFSRTGESQDRKLLGGGIEAMKGVYQTIRMAEGKRLVINVDVSNSCFWHETRFDQLAFLLSGESSQPSFINSAMAPSGGGEPRLNRALRRLAKNRFTVKHRGQTNADKVYVIKRISQYNAKTHKFEVTEKETGKKIEMTCYDYYKKRYNVVIDKWQLPLLETTKGMMFPMEISHMQPGQKYPYKLSETQTAEMIKFAVSRPAVRRQGIQKGLDLLKWSQDPMLKGYGLHIESEMLKTNARILEPPEVLFAKNATAKPAFSGRWDLRGKLFLLPNSQPLKSWGICVLKPSEDHRAPVSKEQVETFKKNFISLYRGHGGKVDNPDPPIVGGYADDAEAINATFTAAGNQVKIRPQMLLVILTNRSADVYNRVKRNCDCRFGVMSQCVQASNVLKNAPQYCSNVLMKFNCKLGGTTSAIKSKTKYFEEPTMIIGADVSHAAPGLEQASMAAMTISIDRTASRYAAAVESNGHRKEMITSDNINSMLRPLIDYWQKNVGGGSLPKHVYYFRDGVSEGQFGPLLKQEVADMKRLFAELGQNHPGNKVKFTVVVAEKRHHIRFFPPAGPAADKNGNPVPGTIVDRDVTHPFENDIYLCSHVAIQGTARPTHYHMLMDEANIPLDRFQAMLYDHCYQYQRATTPVSLFPAVYYAHLASKRGEAHIDMAANAKAALQEERRHKGAGQEAQSHSDEMKSQTEWPKLQPFDTKNQMGLGMWYI